MTNEELRARLWEVEQELAQWQQGKYFKKFKAMAEVFTDDEGKVHWDLFEQSALVGIEPIMWTPCPPVWE